MKSYLTALLFAAFSVAIAVYLLGSAVSVALSSVAHQASAILF